MKNMIFLIGAARSGTKFLRDCLSASNQIEKIPYDIGYVWKYGNEKISHDELTVSDCNKKIKLWIRKTIPRLTKKKSNTNFILEKTVSNSLRVSFVNSIFPDAKFIHIIRNGKDTIISSVNQWKTKPKKKYLIKKLHYFPIENYRYALSLVWNFLKSKIMRSINARGPKYKGIDNDLNNLTIEELCAKQWSRCVDLAEKQLKKINNDKVFIVRYEDIISDQKQIRNLCKFIGINDDINVIKFFKKNCQKKKI